MRIVLDLQACQSPSRLRGIGRYSMALAKAMARRAHRHELIVALNGALPETIDGIRAAFDGLVPRERIVVWSQPSGVGFLTGGSQWRRLAAERLRERFLESLRPDIVHVASLFEGVGDDVSTSVGEVAHRVATAVTLYDLIPLAQREVYLANPAVADWYERKLASLRRSDLLLAISDHSRREAIELLGLPPDRLRTIHSAADPMFRQLNPAPGGVAAGADALLRRYGIERPFIMSAATVEHHKNVIGLFEAFAKLPKAVRAAHQIALVCSLREPDEIRIRNYARRAGLHDGDYVITGHVPDADLVALYNACRLFVFPSLNEGFGLPALEAMACGAAVIASNTTSLPEMVGRVDALFDPYSSDAIAHAMERALGNEAFLEDLRRHGPKRAKLFSWDETACKALEAFEELHDRRRGTPSVAVSRRRPRLAFVCPLSPDPATTAGHAAKLLPELVCHYDIECVAPQVQANDPFVRAVFPLRSAEWFAEHGARYDRVLYHAGNDAHSHSWMADLMKRWPGAVALHAFHVGGVLERSGAWEQELYRSHGWHAVIHWHQKGEGAAEYPCCGSLIKAAGGIIVPSDDYRRLADQWLGAGTAADWITVPFAGTPGICAADMAATWRDAIETHSARSGPASLDQLADDIVTIAAPDAPSPSDWETILRCAAENRRPVTGQRQLMVDVSELVLRDAGTGIQRVTKNILARFMETPPVGFRVEPVFDDGTGTFYYARGLAAKMIGAADFGLPDEPVDVQAGDVFVGVDLIAHQIAGRLEVNRRWRHLGVRFFYVVYDLLPLKQPDWFAPFPQFRHWLQRISSEADGLVCISRSVAQQLLERLPDLEVERADPLRIGHFHLGAEISDEGGAPSTEVEAILKQSRPTFLVVGTVEPRKGHAQALAAFDLLWKQGVDTDLVIVGKQGWKVDELVKRMRTHPEAGQRLHWIERASDADLNAFYNNCSALLAPSLDEGFGLPLIEAAKHALPILARDIPVFREVAGDHAAYFSGTGAKDLANALKDWIADHAAGRTPTTADMPWLTWAQSAEQLAEAIFSGRWDAVWKPGEEPERPAAAVSESRGELVSPL